MNTNETWTAAEEAAFSEMAARRDRVTTARRITVERVVDTFPRQIGEELKVAMTGWLIAYADDVRDALRPHDSGVRVAEKSRADWISWHGGDMPLPHGTRIEVRYRDGEENVDTAGGPFSKRWDHNGFASDIVAYRVLS